MLSGAKHLCFYVHPRKISPKLIRDSSLRSELQYEIVAAILFLGSRLHCRAKIAYEVLVLALARGLIGLSKKRRWMNSRKDSRCQFGRQNFAALARDAKRRAENRLGRRRAHRDYEVGLNGPKLCLQPRAAGSDLARIWFLMDPPFAARLPLEMFHRVGDVNFFPINSSFFQRLIHDFARRPNERFTGNIFVVSRLFADQHD